MSVLKASSVRKRKGSDFLAPLVGSVAIVVGAVVILFYAGGAASAPGEAAVVATVSATLALAALVTGALAGFLFGIPRVLADSASNDPQAARRKYNANTNLEQISDWLTKIIVGATLVSIGTAGSALKSLFLTAGDAIDNDSGSTGAVFAGSMMVYAAVVGFILGWLWARFVLVDMMMRADGAEALLDRANALELGGDSKEAAAKRDQAFELFSKGSSSGADY